jgi:hypothetical protein
MMAKFGQGPPGEDWTGLVLSAFVIDRTNEVIASAVVIRQHH